MPPDLMPNWMPFPEGNGFRGFLGDTGVDMKTLVLWLEDFLTDSPGVLASDCGFALPMKNGCVLLAFSDATSAWPCLGAIILRLLGTGESCSFPSSIPSILLPMSFRCSSSRPYLIVTMRLGLLIAFGFGGEPKVPVFGLNLRTFFD